MKFGGYFVGNAWAGTQVVKGSTSPTSVNDDERDEDIFSKSLISNTLGVKELKISIPLIYCFLLQHQYRRQQMRYPRLNAAHLFAISSSVIDGFETLQYFKSPIVNSIIIRPTQTWICLYVIPDFLARNSLSARDGSSSSEKNASSVGRNSCNVRKLAKATPVRLRYILG